MISKAEIKTIASYKQAKYRNEANVYIVEGVKMVDELIRSHEEIEILCATKEYKNINTERAKQVLEIKEDDLKRISSFTTPNQVLAVVRRKEAKEPIIKSKIVLILDEIKDPGNLGTIIRIADWFGLEDIICSENTVELYNPKTIQSTMGSIFRVNVTYKNLSEFLTSIPQNHPIYGTIIEGGKNIYKEELKSEALIIIGSESHGISPEIRPLITHPITIPSFSLAQSAESLNASIATSIIVSEFKRREI
ncbi:MAG: RNA methyltransferase [Bacteroidales bacterium]